MPWLPEVNWSLLPPFVLLPLLLRVAALHLLLGVAVLTAVPGLVIWYYTVTHQRKGRSLFFFSLTLFSLVYMYYLFLTEVLPRGDVGGAQLLAVTTGVILTLISLTRTKQDPGFVRPRLSEGASAVAHRGRHPDWEWTQPSRTCQLLEMSNRARPVGQRRLHGGMAPACSVRQTWCPTCRVLRPPRAGHCRICSACIYRLDHHCIWINSCVGAANHRSFLLTLLLFLLTSLYGISLVLSSVCPRQNPLFALFYCPGVYGQYRTALCFTCAWYSSIVTGGLLHLLVLQLINISYNVTEREVQLALRQKSGRTQMWGLIVDTGLYSRGFRSNWVEFLTMGAVPNPHLPDPTHLV